LSSTGSCSTDSVFGNIFAVQVHLKNLNMADFPRRRASRPWARGWRHIGAPPGASFSWHPRERQNTRVYYTYAASDCDGHTYGTAITNLRYQRALELLCTLVDLLTLAEFGWVWFLWNKYVYLTLLTLSTYRVLTILSSVPYVIQLYFLYY
jgi:hypothetical protein